MPKIPTLRKSSAPQLSPDQKADLAKSKLQSVFKPYEKYGSVVRKLYKLARRLTPPMGTVPAQKKEKPSNLNESLQNRKDVLERAMQGDF